MGSPGPTEGHLHSPTSVQDVPTPMGRIAPFGKLGTEAERFRNLELTRPRRSRDGRDTLQASIAKAGPLAKGPSSAVLPFTQACCEEGKALLTRGSEKTSDSGTTLCLDVLSREDKMGSSEVE